MTDRPSTPPGETIVLGWVVPRPTGRWHQSFVVTERHLLLTPELTFASNEALTSAAVDGDVSFLDFVRGAGWIARPASCALAKIRGLHWNKVSGLMRIAGPTEDEPISAFIPDRSRGTALEPQLRAAIRARAGRSSTGSSERSTT